MAGWWDGVAYLFGAEAELDGREHLDEGRDVAGGQDAGEDAGEEEGHAELLLDAAVREPPLLRREHLCGPEEAR